MEKASFGMKLKSLDEAGRFTGIAAVANNIDLGGDKIMPGAFTRTLAAGKQFPLLWQHDSKLPIGSVKCTETSQGLQVEGQLLLSVPQAVTAYELLKAGVLKGMSVGYDTVKSTFVGDVRELQELRLWEVSIVTFPMNESAMVTDIKAMSDDDRGKHLKAIDTHRKAIDRHQRSIREHLKAMFDGIDDDAASGDDLALIEDEGDLEEATRKAFVAELQKMASDLNGDTGDSLGPLCRSRIFGAR